ncbi:YbhN family protein [Leifsonia sp. EB34]|uniref:lysylphosphatidylglycerol synthase transmembrane domain-containing protein n=1 Tax=Leifsonia sp. EB34 TaxID=3156303 RepID=UPI0035198B3F
MSAALMMLGIWLIVVPQWQDGARILPRLGRIPITMLSLAAVAQLCSLLCYSAMTKAIVGRGLGYGAALRIDLADLAVNHTVPGGGSVAGAARFRMFVGRGIRPSRALAAASVEVAISNVALGLLFLVGLLLARGVGPFTAPQAWAATSVAALLLVVGFVVWVVLQRTAWLSETVGRLEDRAPALRRLHLTTIIASARDQLTVLGQRPRRLVLCAGLALGNWLLDALSLWLILAALGSPVAPGPLLSAYGVATVLAQLPITPGGLGLVEGVLVPALVAFGVPADTALLGVLGWRALEFWLPIPFGGLSALWLEVERRDFRPS